MDMNRGSVATANPAVEKTVHTKTKDSPRSKKRGRIDRVLLILVIALAVAGLCMVMSTSHYSSLLKGKTGFDAYKGFVDQLIYVVLGIGAMLGLALMPDYAWIRKWSKFLWFAGVALLVLTLIIPSSANGAGRWLKLGPVQFQPAEFVKYFIVVAIAAFLQKHPMATKKRFFNLLLIFGIPAALVLAQKALSMTLVILLMGYFVLIISGSSPGEILGVSVAGVGVVIAGLLLEEFRLKRMIAYFNDEWTDQTRQSIYALANGGLFGQGVQDSRQKYGFLAESDTDFVFSIFAEETGYIGVILLVAVYAFIIWRGYKIAMNARSRFGGYLAFGIIAFFALQAMINMGVASNVFPVTGQTLPFISRGGSSLLANFCAFGILLNISRDVYE